MKSSVMTRILANGAKVLRTFFVKVPATIHVGAVTFHIVHIAFQSLLLPPSLPYLLQVRIRRVVLTIIWRPLRLVKVWLETLLPNFEGVGTEIQG